MNLQNLSLSEDAPQHSDFKPVRSSAQTVRRAQEESTIDRHADRMQRPESIKSLKLGSQEQQSSQIYDRPFPPKLITEVIDKQIAENDKMIEQL